MTKITAISYNVTELAMSLSTYDIKDFALTNRYGVSTVKSEQIHL